MAISKDTELNIADLEQVIGGKKDGGTSNFTNLDLSPSIKNSIKTEIKKERGKTAGMHTTVDPIL